MQEYLVHIEINLTLDIDEQREAELYLRERVRGEELIHAGTLQRIWRIPGGRANVGIWVANDATALHDVFASLPLYPWMTVEVTELATHPLENARPVSTAEATDATANQRMTQQRPDREIET